MYNEMIIGEKTAYLLTRIDEVELTEYPLAYAEYNGDFTVTDMRSATHFEDAKKVKDLAVLKNQISKLMGSNQKYRVIAERVTRQEIDLETGKPIPVPETPVEVAP